MESASSKTPESLPQSSPCPVCTTLQYAPVLPFMMIRSMPRFALPNNETARTARAHDDLIQLFHTLDVSVGNQTEGTRMRYVDGYVLPVPKKNLRAYRGIAKKAGAIWKEHGALEYRECAGDDLDNKW